MRAVLAARHLLSTALDASYGIGLASTTVGLHSEDFEQEMLSAGLDWSARQSALCTISTAFALVGPRQAGVSVRDV
jgi:hypothetical protein